MDCYLSDLGLVWTDYVANLLLFFIYIANSLCERRDDFIALFRVLRGTAPAMDDDCCRLPPRPVLTICFQQGIKEQLSSQLARLMFIN